MTETMVNENNGMIQEIEVNKIKPSPFQNRRKFNGIEQFAKDIERDGLLQPVVIRPVEDGYELVAGERRFRAVSLFSKTILARVMPMDDRQAMRMCLEENLNRNDLGDEEKTVGIVNLIDTELKGFEDYDSFADTAQQRVKFLLGKMHADYVNKTDYFINKFINKLESIFAMLPYRKNWHSFFMNDLPLLNIPDIIKDIASDNKLNKSQIKAIARLQKEAPKAFSELVSKKSETGEVVLNHAEDESESEPAKLSELSAKDIDNMRKEASYSEIAQRIQESNLKPMSQKNQDLSDEVHVGDVYLINGRHKLIVANADDVDFIKTHSGVVDCVLTDPPYGISYKSPAGSGLAQRGDYAVLANDDVEFKPDVLFQYSDKVITWGANHYANKLPNTPGWIVWDKREGEQINNNSDCEIAWTNMLGSARVFSHKWNGMIKASEQGIERIHPTQKPIALFKYCLEMCRAGDVVLDLYAGSGTCLLACEETNRTAILVELSPIYASAMLRRFKSYDLEVVKQ